MSEFLLGPVGRRLLHSYSWLLLIFIVAPAAILIPISFSSQSSFVFPPREFSFEWYQRLISVGARETIVCLNSRVETFRESLPTAAHLLDSALAQAQKLPA